ncbi:MAG: hypothetical protein PF689_04910, partial [Deltaproteobacteria bacterium]|nr:hypothetical protein [Deltaproteobacteria bacterium]
MNSKVFLYLASFAITLIFSACFSAGQTSTPGSNYRNIDSYPDSGKYSWQLVTKDSEKELTTRQYWQVKLNNNKARVQIKFVKLGHSRKGFPCSGSNYYKVKNEYSYSGKYDEKTESYDLTMKESKLSDSTCGDISEFSKKIKIVPLAGKRFLIKDANRKSYIIHNHSIKGTWYWVN